MVCSVFVKLFVSACIVTVLSVTRIQAQADRDSPAQPISSYSPWTRYQNLFNDSRSDLFKLMKINRYLYPRVLKNSTGVYASSPDLNEEAMNTVVKQHALWEQRERTYRIPPPPELLPSVSSGSAFPLDDWLNREKYNKAINDAYIRSVIKTHREHLEGISAGPGPIYTKKSERPSSKSVVAAVMIFMGILSIIVRIAGKSKQHSGADLRTNATSDVENGGIDQQRSTDDLTSCRIIPCRGGSHRSNNATPTDDDYMSDSSYDNDPISLVSCYPSSSAHGRSNRARVNGNAIVITRKDRDYPDPPPPYPGYPSNLPPTPSIPEGDPPPYPGIVGV